MFQEKEEDDSIVASYSKSLQVSWTLHSIRADHNAVVYIISIFLRFTNPPAIFPSFYEPFQIQKLKLIRQSISSSVVFFVRRLGPSICYIHLCDLLYHLYHHRAHTCDFPEHCQCHLLSPANVDVKISYEVG